MHLGSHQFLEKKPNTRRSEETHIKPGLARPGDRALASITPDDIDALIPARQKAGMRPDTVRNEIAALPSGDTRSRECTELLQKLRIAAS